MPIAERLAFVDVETTGSAPGRGRVTEVGIVLVDWPSGDHAEPAPDGHPLHADPPDVDPPDADSPDADPPDQYALCARALGALDSARVRSWSSLVDPGIPIPPEIRFLTGIDDRMVRGAPSFDALAACIAAQLEGAIFIAHHARFDYGFIKAEMARAGRRFQARTLCTVRLSRLLNPQRSPHTLDAIIARHRLPCPDRHRALGDATVLWHFLRSQVREHGEEAVEQAARKLLKRPALPAHLSLESIEAVPAAPGIYKFFGLNAHPLYIGRSRDIRKRVASHFCADHQSERGLRLASETHRIEWQQTAGEFGAALAEIAEIERCSPAHNRALRRNANTVVVTLSAGESAPRYRKTLGLAAAELARGYGPFASRAAARACLLALAREHRLCLVALGLERARAGAPCFARQLGRCAGACEGREPAESTSIRLAAALAPHAVPAWPDARLVVCELDPERERESWHLFDQWRTIAAAASFAALIDAGRGIDPLALPFDRHVYALLRGAFDTLPSWPPIDWPPATKHATAAPHDRSTLEAHWHRSRMRRTRGGLRAIWWPREDSPPAAAAIEAEARMG